jgi:hypothetical protein
VPEDAVGCEPVSAPNSLLTGKLTGNLPISGVSAANLTTSLRACARPDRATWAACRRRRGDRVVFFAAIAHSRLWHKADISRCPLFVRFSNRPSGSSTFRLTTTPVSMSLTGSRFSSDSAPRPFHHGDSKTRWNNLSGGLAVNMTAGPSGQTISPHPSSRAGHHSTARWSSISSYRI